MPPRRPITLTRVIQIRGQPIKNQKKNFWKFLKFFLNFLFSNYLVRTLKCKKKFKKKYSCPWKHEKTKLKSCSEFIFGFFWAAFLELPIRPKIDFPYWKLGGGTLCSFYFVEKTFLGIADMPYDYDYDNDKKQDTKLVL